jgi:hypothetical protein
MFDALLIGTVAGIFVTLITSSRRLRGPIPLQVAPRLREARVPAPIPTEATRPAAVPSQVPQPSPVPSDLRRRSRLEPIPAMTRVMAAVRAGVARAVLLFASLRPRIAVSAPHRRRAIGLVLAFAVSAVVWFVWPTPYRALPLRASGARIGKSFDVVALRQQRITGRVDALVTGGGWVCLTGCGLGR